MSPKPESKPQPASCCAYAATFDRIYAKKGASDTLIEMLFLPTPEQSERDRPDFHAHLGHIHEEWKKLVSE